MTAETFVVTCLRAGAGGFLPAAPVATIENAWRLVGATGERPPVVAIATFGLSGAVSAELDVDKLVVPVFSWRSERLFGTVGCLAGSPDPVVEECLRLALTCAGGTP